MRLSSASVLSVTAAVLPAVAVIAPLGIAPLLVVAVFAVVAARVRNGEGFDALRSVPSALLFLLLVWAAATLLWTPEVARGVQTLGKLAFTFAGGLLLLDSARKLGTPERLVLGKALAVGVAAALVYLAIDIYGDGLLRGPIMELVEDKTFYPHVLNRAVTISVLLLWPALIVLRHLYGGRAMWLGLAAAVAMLAGSESATALVGLGAGALIFVLAAVPRIAPALRPVTTVGAVLSVLALPLLAGGPDRMGSWQADSSLQNSLAHRIFIWDFAATRALQKPWSGWGLESSRALGGKPANLQGQQPGETALEAHKRSFRVLILPLHPHNGGLQVWVELGAPGALLLAGLLAWLFWTAGDRTRWSAASGSMLAQAVAGYAIASSSYGIWQSWWMSSLWLSAVMATAVAPLTASREQRP